MLQLTLTKMNKKIIMMLFIAFAALSTSNAQSVTNKMETKHLQKMESQRMESRVREIYGMDKSRMTAEQKHALRSEVMAMKSSMHSAGGFYISAGALILILLLLIIFL